VKNAAGELSSFTKGEEASEGLPIRQKWRRQGEVCGRGAGVRKNI